MNILFPFLDEEPSYLYLQRLILVSPEYQRYKNQLYKERMLEQIAMIDRLLAPPPEDV